MDLKVTFLSEKPTEHYVKRKFELTNLLVMIERQEGVSLQQKSSSSLPSRQVKRVQLFTGQISIGRIMVLRALLNRFFNCCVTFGSAARSIGTSVHPFFIAVQVETHRITLLFRTGNYLIFSTGIGRSGTFLLVDSILKMVREQLSRIV